MYVSMHAMPPLCVEPSNVTSLCVNGQGKTIIGGVNANVLGQNETKAKHLLMEIANAKYWRLADLSSDRATTITNRSDCERN